MTLIDENDLKAFFDGYVKRIQETFDRKNLNDQGGGRASVAYVQRENKHSIVGKGRLGFLEYGRKAGVAPPFDVIKGWVERKLNIPDDQVEGVAWAIVNKIKKHGTNILTDKTKGLRLELLADEINKEIKKKISKFAATEVVNNLAKLWQSPK